MAASDTQKSAAHQTATDRPGSVTARHSLRRRLPLLILAVLTAVGGSFAWMSFREVERALRLNGSQHIAAAAGQVAELLAQSAASRVAETARLARDPDVRRVLLSGSIASEEAAPAAVRSFVARNQQTTIWLYGSTGALIGRLAGNENTSRSLPPPEERVPPEGVSPLRSQDRRVWYHVTAAVSTTDRGAAPVGYLSVQRSLASSPTAMGLIERLIGTGAAIKIGNVGGDLWTDLSAPVPAPPPTAPGGSASYRTDAGQVRLGTAVAVPGAPWLVWAEGSEAAMLAPAHTLMRGMLPIGLLLTAFGALTVYIVSARVTRPLEHVAQAAEAIAAGDYSRRVLVDRRDEIGRLGAAFNIMAARVGAASEALESRVRDRTRELERTREELDQFFALSLDLLCIADMDGRFRRVNPAWETVLGWTVTDLTAAPYLDFVHPDDRAATSLEAANLSDGLTTSSFENRFRCKDGSYRWLSWKAVPLPDRGLIYAVAHDVTEQKRAARDLEQQAAELAEANRDLEAFSYSVSHDLRAPLRHLTGFAALLEKAAGERLDEQGRRYVKTIHDAATHMGRLIDDLLTLSRIGRAEMRRTTVDLNHIVADAKREVQREAGSSPIEWSLGALPVVIGDPSLLHVAFVNLLSNAVKYTGTRATPRIEISADGKTPAEAVVCIRDNGVGFDMRYVHKLFGVFQRLHRQEDFDGTGIGLATVRRIIQRHGGRVWAEGVVDAGSTFFLALPRGGSGDDHQA